MTASKALVLDPGLEELLRAVASDSDSTLLRVPRPSRLRAPYGGAEPGRISSVGLSSAERALLDTHRAELAGLLADAAMDALVFGDGGRRYMGRFDAAGAERSRVDPAALRLRTAALPRGFEGEDEARAAKLLERDARGEPGNGPRFLEFATLAFALQPSLRTRGVHAFSLWAAGDCSGAIAQAVHWIESAPRSPYLPHAWELVCIARARQGRMLEAHAAQVRGLELGVPTAVGLMNRLTMAVQAGAENDARVAARVLDETLQEYDPRVADYVAMSNSRRGPDGWMPTAAARSIVRGRWALDAEGASRRILDALR